MLTLAVDLRASGGRSASFVFRTSPVTIGSGLLNELVLDFPHVTSCHATIHFDEAGARLIDLGSRNGTVVAGIRAEANHAVSLASDTEIVIGPVLLRARVATADEPADDDLGDAGDRPRFGAVADPPADRPDDGKKRRTTALLPGFSAAQFLASLQPPAAPTSGPSQPAALARKLTATFAQLPLPSAPPLANAPVGTTAEPAADWPAPAGPATEREAPRHVRRENPAPIGDGVATARPSAPLAGFTRRLPVDGAAPGQSNATTKGISSLQFRLTELAAALPTQADRQVLLDLVALAEHAVDSFIALKTMRQTLADELGLRIVRQGDAVQRTSSSTELLGYLMGAPDGFSGRLRQLSRATSELLVVHEMAFMGALHDGVTDLVQRLDPRGQTFKEQRRLGLFGLRDYENFYASETEDPWLAVMGNTFARSYTQGTCTDTVDSAPTGDAVSGAQPPHSHSPYAARRIPPASIKFLTGPLGGREISVGVTDVTIGRAEDNVLVIDHASVSRHHAAIRRDPHREGWIVADAGSRNGIAVNGQVVATAALTDGDVVELGEISFQFQSAPGPG